MSVKKIKERLAREVDHLLCDGDDANDVSAFFQDGENLPDDDPE
ncbi:MAG: hypothetical protein P8010_17955 [Desulfosarcinaceae bacterium]